MALEVKSIDESTALEHYGVMGMKWGVRKDGKPQGFQPPKSKRQAKKMIKGAAKAYRKQTGTKNTVGARVAKVDSQVKSAYSKDKKLQQLRKQRDEDAQRLTDSNKRVDKLRQKEEQAKRSSEEARIIYDEVGANGSASQQLNAKRDYKQASKEHEKLRDARIEAENENDTLRGNYYTSRGKVDSRKSSIASEFKEKHLNAAVRDLGFKDVEQGRKMLKDYDLESYAMNPRLSERLWNKSEREV